MKQLLHNAQKKQLEAWRAMDELTKCLGDKSGIDESFFEVSLYNYFEWDEAALNNYYEKVVREYKKT